LVFSFHHGTNVGAGSLNLLPCTVYHGKTPKDKGVGHTGALPITFLKSILQAKEELWKLKYFTMKKYHLQKNPPNINQNHTRY
jgi:hypothetical protein